MRKSSKPSLIMVHLPSVSMPLRPSHHTPVEFIQDAHPHQAITSTMQYSWLATLLMETGLLRIHGVLTGETTAL
jgi:hypothetical protein